MANEVLFEARHMHKAFGPTIALKDVDFTLRRGEIRGLIGENGSGKSTIMSIASGMQPATSGEMLYLGKPWHPQSMIESQRAGISMIFAGGQHHSRRDRGAEPVCRPGGGVLPPGRHQHEKNVPRGGGAAPRSSASPTQRPGPRRRADL